MDCDVMAFGGYTSSYWTILQTVSVPFASIDDSFPSRPFFHQEA